LTSLSKGSFEMNVENKLYKKTIIWNGDSICSGSATEGNWATRIAEKNEMIYKNYAHGGGTITANMPLKSDGNRRHSVCETLDTMYREFPNADYVVIEGGTNDADLLGLAVDGVPNGKLGGFDGLDFSGNYDESTFCGALESVFYRATRYWMGKKIVFIVAQKMAAEPICYYENRRFYFEKAIEICKKWGIPYLDLWDGCYLNPYLPWMYDKEKSSEQNKLENTCFYCDGQHLTSRGYDLSADIIDSWLKSV